MKQNKIKINKQVNPNIWEPEVGRLLWIQLTLRATEWNFISPNQTNKKLKKKKAWAHIT